MSREIKFRAWYAKTKEMFEVTDMQWSASFANKISKLEIISLKSPYPIYVTTGNGCESYELMQYVGLKDSNGQGIYEGDIVRCGHFALNDTTKFGERPLGKFSQGLQGTDITTEIWIMKVEWDFDVLSVIKRHITQNPDVIGVEVIGNVYQHPELLR